MSVTVTFNNDDPNTMLADMAIMAGVSARPVSGVSSDTGPKTGAAQSGETGQTAETVRPPRATRKKPEGPALNVVAEDPKSFILTGDEREPAQTQVQDALDEKPETKADDAPLTLDDVRNAAKSYIDKWGKEAAAKDLVPIVMQAGGVPNIGKLDPTDQALLRKVADAFKDAAKADKRFVAAA